MGLQLLQYSFNSYTYDDNLDPSKTCPVLRRCELAQQEPGHPDEANPLIPVRPQGVAGHDGINGYAGCDCLGFVDRMGQIPY